RRPPTAETPGPSEAVNLATVFTDKELEKMGGRCIDDYESDVRSRAPRMKKIAEGIRLYASDMRPKSFPFQNCANVNLPTLTAPWLQVHARLFDMVWPANGKVILSAPTNLEDKPRADATELFANSYIRTRIPEMGPGLDDTMYQTAGFGSAFRRTYWDAHEGRIRSDYIPIQDFVVAHSVRSQDPSMRDVPRYTMVQHLTIFDLEAYAADGVYVNVKGIRASDREAVASDDQVKQVVERVDGVSGTEDDSDEDRQRQILEMHRVWRMPDRKGKNPLFDGKAHPVMITLDASTKRVLRFAVREEDDPADAKRFQRQSQAFAEFQARLSAYEAQLQEIDRVLSAAEQLGKTVPVDLPIPLKPAEVKSPKPQRKREIAFFTHYRAFPSEGFYGLGFVDFIGPLAKAVNTIINQHIDGTTLKNAKPVFMSRNLRTQRGPVNIQPGGVIEVDGSTQAMKDGIFWMDPPPNDPTTMPLAQMIASSGDKIAGSGDLMSGETSGANRTAKEIQVLNAQVMAAITVLARRVKEAQKHEFDKMWRCWSVFLEPDDFDVLDESGQPKTVSLTPDMFRTDAHVAPAADPRLKFERVEEQTVLYGLVVNNPFLMQSPNGPALMKMATEDLFRAHGAEKYVPLIPSPPPPPPTSPPKPPFEEEAGWLRTQDSPVHPDDNDLEHINSHKYFGESAAGAVLDATGKQMLERHIRAHTAQWWEKANGGGPQPGSAPMPQNQGPPIQPSHHAGGPKGAPPAPTGPTLGAPR